MLPEVETFSIDNEYYKNYCISSIGGRDENQDCYGMLNTRRGLLSIVCDGMGGVEGGAIASAIAVEEIVNFVNQPPIEDDIDNSDKMILLKAINHANQKILEEGKFNPSLAGMGTTVVALLINEMKATIAYVGDSRIYQIRKGKKIFRTSDHSLVFQFVKEKLLTEEQARLSTQSNVILRALGQKEDIEVDVFELPYDKGDIFFLCTDGVWGTMPEGDLIDLISENKHPKMIMDSLAIFINTNAMNDGGGHDNLTASYIKTTLYSKLRTKMERKLKIMLLICTILLILSVIANFIPRKSIESKSDPIPKTIEKTGTTVVAYNIFEF